MVLLWTIINSPTVYAFMTIYIWYKRFGFQVEFLQCGCICFWLALKCLPASKARKKKNKHWLAVVFELATFWGFDISKKEQPTKKKSNKKRGKTTHINKRLCWFQIGNLNAVCQKNEKKKNKIGHTFCKHCPIHIYFLTNCTFADEIKNHNAETGWVNNLFYVTDFDIY